MKKIYLTMALCLMTLAAANAAIDRSRAQAFDRPAQAPRASEAITQTPAGDLKLFSREAYSYYIGFGGGVTGPSYTDDFVSSVVFDGNDVYLQNPIFEFPTGAFIKGTLEGDKITFNFPQPVGEVGGETVYVNRFNCQWTAQEDEKLWYFIAEEDNCMILTLNSDGSMTMEESAGFEHLEDPDHIFGVSLADGMWGGYAEWDAVYTPVKDETTPVPDDLQTEVYQMRYNEMAGMTVNVGFYDDKVYINNLSADFPASCIVGTLADGKVTFPSHQYLGVNSEFNAKAYFWSFKYEWTEDDYYGEGWNMVPTEQLVFDWDPDTKSLTTAEAYLINIGDEEMAYAAIFDMPQIKYPTEFKASAPENPLFVQVDDYNPDPNYDYARMIFWISMFNVNDQLMDTDRVYYNVFFGSEPYVFTPEVFINLKEPMTNIPFSFVDSPDYNGYEIKAYGPAHYIYFDGQSDINMQSVGLQAVYVDVDGMEYKSDLVYYNSEGAVVAPEMAAAEVVAVEYTDLNGMRVENPAKGVYLKTLRFADGTSKTVKALFNR